MFRKGLEICKGWLKTGNIRRAGLFAGVLLLVLAVPNLAHAFDPIGTLLGIIAKFFELLTHLVGMILFLEVKGLIEVAQYSNFVAPGPTAVRIGWVVARDLANMFFILILLVIAFATIVGYEEYNLRRLLPRLLIMAVVINFSKTITGIFIDMGQVIMLTFVNGFKDAAAGNFLSAFQINKLLTLSENGDMSQGGLVVGMMLAFAMVTVAAMVVLIMLVTLAFRIVMLWLIIILAPIAFLAGTIPPGQQYYKMWWDELKRYVIYGPVVAFFLWLALLTAQMSNGNLAAEQGFTSKTAGATQQEIDRARTTGSSGNIPTAAANSDVILSMIIFTALLFGGLKVATQVGGVGGGVASKLQGYAKGAAKFAAKKAGGLGLRTGGLVARGTARGAGAVGGFVGDKLGQTKLGQNKSVRKVGRAAGFVGRAATGAVYGAGTIASVQGRRLGGTGGFGKAKKAIMGSAEEAGKVSPKALAGRAKLAFGDEAIEVAKALEGNKQARDAAISSGSMLSLQQRLAKAGKTDDGARSAAGNLSKYVIDQLPPNEAAIAGATISGKEAFKYITPERYARSAEYLDKGAIEALGNGTNPQMREAVAHDFMRRENDGTLDEFMADNGMSFPDIPVGAYSGDPGTITNEQKQLAKRIAQEAAVDPDVAKKVYSDSSKRTALKEPAQAILADAKPGPQRGRAAVTSAITGGLTDANISASPNLASEFGLLPAETLENMVKNAPKGDAEVTKAISRIVTEAVKNGTSDVAERILRSGSMDQYVDADVADDARQLSGRHISGVTLAGRESMADKDAAGDVAGANDLRAAIGDLRSATRDLAAKEHEIAAQKQRYASFEKTGNSVQMGITATVLSALTTELGNIKNTTRSQMALVKART